MLSVRRLSGIVSTWIAVVFDLVDKVRELALTGDAAASAIDQQHEQYLQQIATNNEQGKKKALEFENGLLDVCARQLQLFDPHQLRDLKRLHLDRHQCAHPTFQRPGDPFRPTAEQARLYLRIAVEHVLSQPPVQGRAAIDEISATVSSQYFPKTVNGALTTLRSSPLRSARDSLVNGCVDALVFGYADPASTLFKRSSVALALCAALEMHWQLVEPRLRKQLSKVVSQTKDELLPDVAEMISNITGGLEFLDAAATARLQEFMRSAPISTVIRFLVSFAALEAYADIVRNRVATLDVDTLADAISNHRLGATAKGRALDLLSRSMRWDPVNRVFLS